MAIIRLLECIFFHLTSIWSSVMVNGCGEHGIVFSLRIQQNIPKTTSVYNLKMVLNPGNPFNKPSRFQFHVSCPGRIFVLRFKCLLGIGGL